MISKFNLVKEIRTFRPGMLFAKSSWTISTARWRSGPKSDRVTASSVTFFSASSECYRSRCCFSLLLLGGGVLESNLQFNQPRACRAEDGEEITTALSLSSSRAVYKRGDNEEDQDLQALHSALQSSRWLRKIRSWKMLAKGTLMPAILNEFSLTFKTCWSFRGAETSESSK